MIGVKDWFIVEKEGGEEMQYIKKLEKYFSKHIWYGNAVHLSIGIGVGILATYPLVGSHPLRWGIFFLALGLLGHLWAISIK